MAVPLSPPKNPTDPEKFYEVSHHEEVDMMGSQKSANLRKIESVMPFPRSSNLNFNLVTRLNSLKGHASFGSSKAKNLVVATRSLCLR